MKKVCFSFATVCSPNAEFIEKKVYLMKEVKYILEEKKAE